MTPQEQKDLADLANEFRAVVSAIEASALTTRNHYGRYMQALLTLGDGTPEREKELAGVLVAAGANKQGVADALNLVT